MPKQYQRADPVTRFVAKVDFTDECWDWSASVTPHGYGRFYAGGGATWVYAHRYAWETFVGPIPEGLTIDHLCRNPRCVNPDHLDPVSLGENIRRIPRAPKQACCHGHPFTPDNLRTDKRGHRFCRTCNRMRQITPEQKQRKVELQRIRRSQTKQG